MSFKHINKATQFKKPNETGLINKNTNVPTGGSKTFSLYFQVIIPSVFIWALCEWV